LTYFRFWLILKVHNQPEVFLMPTVLQVGPYSFIFFSSDRPEPPHIHVKRDRQIAKFWLEPISVANNQGFKDHELNQITRLVEEYQQRLLEAWHDHFNA
jgi:hypothetical protein